MPALTKFSQELADKICDTIATSNKSLRTICKENYVTSMTVLRWLSDEDKKLFVAQYTRAKEEQADFLAEEMLEIADDSSNDTIMIYDKSGKLVPSENREWINRSRLRVDTRKFLASKLKPKKYGDKVDITSKGDKIITGLAIQINTNVPPLALDDKA